MSRVESEEKENTDHKCSVPDGNTQHPDSLAQQKNRIVTGASKGKLDSKPWPGSGDNGVSRDGAGQRGNGIENIAPG